MRTLAILITVHNRIDKTIRCLDQLFKQDGLGELYSLKVFLVDDGSSDGTAEMVQKHFPDVFLIKGNGNLYWNRGMCLAWETAVNEGNYHGYVWLNNDTFLFENAIKKLIDAADSTSWQNIICGSTNDPLLPEKLTYGGCTLYKNGSYEINYPNGSIQECNIINGNIVLVPQLVFKTVGMLDKSFSHAIGDNDYSLRALKSGIRSYSIDFIGSCSKNTNLAVWKSSKYPLSKRLNSLYHPLSGTPPFESFRFRLRHYGFIQAIRSVITLHIRVLFPSQFN